MAISKYIRHDVGTEQNLYADLISESIQQYGINTYFLPRTLVARDAVLNSDAESQFNSAHVVEMYIENVDGFGGTGDLMQKFGFEIRDEVTLIVAKRSWNRWVGQSAKNNRPMEGDIVYIPYSKSYFEITHVEHEQPFYQLANLPVYKLKCSMFEYNGEVFNTGLKQIDEIKIKFAKRTKLRLINQSGKFRIGDRFMQVISLDPIQEISGEIVAYNDATGIIELIDIATSNGQFGQYNKEFGEFLPGELGNCMKDTTATALVETVYSLDTKGLGDAGNDIDENSQSYEFEQFGNDIIDFSENNPFGVP
jgi:hypothetical protein